MNIFSRTVEFFREIWTFRSTLKEWFGEGGIPVSQETADARAAMCLACDFNRRSTFGIETASNVLKRRLETKRRLGLSVFGEERLHSCELCRCHLPLKIHVPIKFIRQYQREDVRQAIKRGKSECWQLCTTD
jgi:hypothetical protein